jgi:pseudaminic acid synthase
MLSFRKAILEDTKLYFDWANDSDVREQSFNSDTIDFENHKRWFECKLNDDSCMLLIFKNYEDFNIGQIRIQKENENEALIGISIAAEHRGKGYAKDMLQMASDYFLGFNPSCIIKAFVKEKNLSSKFSFEKAGFEFQNIINYENFISFHYIKKKRKMTIDTFEINSQSKVFIIAELSANHNGNIETAIDTIRAAKRAGADCIKLQTYTADTITIDCDKDDFLIKGTIWEGKNLYQLYQEAYTPWEWHQEIFKVAKEEGIICFSSPFDKTAVDFLETLNVPAYKIASFEITDIPLIEYVASKGKPIILSTGIAEQADIELALDACRRMGNNDVALLKCTSSYPAPIDEANMCMVKDLAERYNVISGLSDHTMGATVPVVATCFGAKIIEKHFILDRSIGGPDASFSMNEEEFTAMVKAVREAESAIGKVDYSLTEKQAKGKDFSRSLYVVEDMKAGDIITEKNVRSIRPGFGMHPKYYNEILGQSVKIDLERGVAFESIFTIN